MAEATVGFGCTSIFGEQTGWNPQNYTKKTSKQRARSLGGTGNETGSKLYDEKTDASQNFEAATVTAPTVAEIIGALVGGYILTAINLVTSATAMATMALTGHNHGSNAHANTLMQAAHGVTLDSGFGAQDFLEGTAGDNAEVESGNLTIALQHRDKVGGNAGAHFIGQNYDCMMTATVTWIGTPSAVSDGTWGVTESDETTGNTEDEKHTYTGTKSVALAPPA